MFNKFDLNGDNVLDITELKHMMEKLGEPQTHVALKGMIKEVDEDDDGCLSFRELLLVYSRVASGDIGEDNPLARLVTLSEIDVHEEGVAGAKNFFQAKIEQMQACNKFEQEIRDEQEEKRKDMEERKVRRQAFKATAKVFEQ